MRVTHSTLLLGALVCMPCSANDFPTVGRVEYVLECMRDHTGGQFELLNKCSCAIDRLAKQYRYEEFVEAQTMAKSVSIAGERGSTMRDNEQAQTAAKRFRASVAGASRACFLR